jgi:hypothetical protein
MIVFDVFDSFERKKIFHMKRTAKSHMQSVLNEKILVSIGHYLVVSGNAFTSWHDQSELKDIDVFVLHDDIAKHQLRTYLAHDGFKHKDAEYLKQTNPGATHVQEIWEAVSHGKKYQFIFTDYWDRKDLIKEFDYKHCMVSYDVGKDIIYITRSIYDAIDHKHLIVNNENRVAEWRRNKFLDRGFTEPTKAEENFVTWIDHAYPAIAARLTQELIEIA